MHVPILSTARRELAHRASAGLEITLYWNASDNSTSIVVIDTVTAEIFTFPVSPERALDAFHHPFAHLAELDAAA
ncbi:MAG TPA: hypothetical protein VKC65_05105 [Gaiellaceae bacterium]|nr:hypothetical protein [Gaiellaceae bacterium]